MSQILLKEYFQLTPTKEVISEAKEALQEGGPMIVKGVIQRADAKNQNGRIYPVKILKKEMDRYVSEYVNKGTALGELDHTEEPVIALQNVSHRIVEVTWDGNDVHGKVQLLNTPKGKIAQELVLSGVPLGISSRAIGSVSKNEDKDGADVVQDDLQMICFDLVGTPSTHGAFLGESRVITNFDKRKILPPEVRIKEVLSDILGRKL